MLMFATYDLFEECMFKSHSWSLCYAFVPLSNHNLTLIFSKNTYFIIFDE